MASGNEKNQKIVSTVKNILSWTLIAIAVFMMLFTIISVTTFDKNDRDLFGYKAFIVKTDSMKATDFAAGDLVLVKEVDPSVLEVGDIITFQSQDPEMLGEIVTHKIREVREYPGGLYSFVTYGTTTDSDDPYPVEGAYVLGRYEGKIPNAGHFFSFLKTPLGYGICILLPFLALIGVQAFNCVKLFRKYKSEQTAALDEEREALRREREEAKRMMEELEALKKQLAEQKETKEE